MLFENRQSRFKEVGKKVPQAYRVYVEDAFLPCDAEDACLFPKTAEFYVFYNGIEPFPTDHLLKLSDAFILKTEQPSLELLVKVININQQHYHHRILKVCKPMYEYSLFVDTVRKWKAIDAVNGFQKAIEECIANNVLKDYLMRKSKEVLNMLIGEYDYEMDIAVQRAEEREIAFAEGIERGIERGIEQGIERGKSLGIAEGAYQKALETARRMKQSDCVLDFIVKITGLTESEIENL